MENTFDFYSILIPCLLIYGALAITKVILCLSSLPAAVSAMQRKTPDMSSGLITLLMVLSIFFVIPFLIIPAMYAEGWRFFFTYRNTDVMRQVIKGM